MVRSESFEFRRQSSEYRFGQKACDQSESTLKQRCFDDSPISARVKKCSFEQVMNFTAYANVPEEWKAHQGRIFKNTPISFN